MATNKQIQTQARQLFKLSLVDGRISPEHVAGVLAYVEKNPPRQVLSTLKAYYHLVKRELARSHAIVEHAGALPDAALSVIAAALSKKYSRPITASAKPAPNLIAGLRVRVGDDVYEASIAGQLETLATAV